MNHFLSRYWYDLLLRKKIAKIFLKVKKRVQKITETLHNLHVYIEKVGTSHALNCKWKYIIIRNSSISFLSELEKMKSCIYRVQTANAGMVCKLWHHLPVLLLEETERVCKIQVMKNVCNQYPMLILHKAGSHFYRGKSLIVRNWNIVTARWTKVPILD